MDNIRRKARCVFILCVVGVLPGCADRQHLRCQFVSTNMTKISVDPTDARVITLDCPRAYWWVDDTGRLCVAGRMHQPSLIDEKLDRIVAVSLVLGEPSKGVGKDFKADRNTLRGYIKTKSAIYRFKSVYGFVGVEHRDNDVLVGAFRANSGLSIATFLGGWSSASPYLVFGTFRAIKDAQKGRPIRDLTEQPPYDRQLNRLEPVTRPASH